MADLTKLRAAVVGTGFIGVVHVEALRRLGIEVVGVVGSSPERARAKAATTPLPAPFDSFESMLADERVDVVHLTTPNHLHYDQVTATLAAGKHVVCFWDVHGGYLQDWLLLPTDWNWRLEPDKGGGLRAVTDIGSHWVDLVEFVTRRRVEELLADLATTIPVRRRPVGEVETFAAADDVERVDAPMSTEDLAHVLLRFGGGGHGSAVVSQVSAGRKNSLRFEIDGSLGALAWDAERPEELWLGHRGRPNETLLRNPALLEPEAAARTTLPAGHAEGFADTFKELYRAVYTAVAAGVMPEEPDFPTFADGHRANVVADAVSRSARDKGWVEVPA